MLINNNVTLVIIDKYIIAFVKFQNECHLKVNIIHF